MVRKVRIGITERGDKQTKKTDRKPKKKKKRKGEGRGRMRKRRKGIAAEIKTRRERGER